MSSINKAIFRQAFNLLCDEVIGRGMSRTVYSSKLLPGHVIKCETAYGKFQNVMEWETWQRVKDTPLSRWFAACKDISGDGTVLIMERTSQPTPKEFPAEVPHFLCDYKRKNYGMSAEFRGGGGKRFFVCHDYGTLAFERSLASTSQRRMCKVKWSDLDD